MDVSTESAFLRLTPVLREKIYCLAGAVRPCFAVLEGKSGARQKPKCHDPIPVGLLSTNRLIHDEILPLIYSENTFYLKGRPEHIAAALNRLSRKAITAIKLLHIHLEWDKSSCHSLVLRSIDEISAVDLARRQLQASAQQWLYLCRLLATCLIPGIVTFSVSCMSNEPKFLNAIIQPMCYLPRMKNCAIWFGPDPDSIIESRYRRDYIASSLCKSLCEGEAVHNKTRTPRLAFEDLPPEVRRLIYTMVGLSGPHQLFPGNDLGLSQDAIHIFDERLRIKDPQSCCGTCRGSLSMSKPGTCHEILPLCICSTHTPAYSTTCTCFRLPVEMFRLNHRLYSEISLIFYGENVFSFHDTPAETLSFLQTLPLRLLHLIRKIRIEPQRKLIKDVLTYWVEPFNSTYSINTQQFGRDWDVLIRFIARHMDLPNLSVTISTRLLLLLGNSQAHEPRDYSLTASKAIEERMLEPLHELRGLRSFYAEFCGQDGLEMRRWAVEVVMGEGCEYWY